MGDRGVGMLAFREAKPSDIWSKREKEGEHEEEEEEETGIGGRGVRWGGPLCYPRNGRKKQTRVKSKKKEK